RRRAAAAAGGAALVVAVAGVSAVPGRDGRQAQAVQAAPQVYGAVLVKDAVFGWLPSGYTTLRVAQGDDGYTLTAGRPGQKAGGLTLQLTEGAEPPVPNLPGKRPGHTTPTAPVNGRPASWVIKPGADGSEQVPAEFRWRYADRRWAELMIAERGVATEATVRRIAENVRFGAGRAAAFPVRIGGAPSGMRIARAWVGWDGRTPGKGTDVELSLAPRHGTFDGDGLSLSFSPEALPAPSWAGQGGQPGEGGQAGKGAPNAKVGGRLADERPLTDPATGNQGGTLTVFGWHGFDVRIEARGQAARTLAASGGARGLFERITYLGDDQAKWTTAPLG
ncbi:hypothetical protein, partial [Actinomadura harenae]